jgi:hypothetical protein
MVAIVQPDLIRFFDLVSLGVIDYSWEIVDMDFVNELNKSSEFHLTTILVFFCHLTWHTFFRA